MNNLNSVLIEGMSNNPEVKVLPNGNKVATFEVACTRSFKYGDEAIEEVSRFEVEAWSRLAETVASKLVAGRGVRLVGRLKQERWLDVNGKPQSKVKIVAEHVEIKPVEVATSVAEYDTKEG